jgi:hypothetical protein
MPCVEITKVFDADVACIIAFYSGRGCVDVSSGQDDAIGENGKMLADIIPPPSNPQLLYDQLICRKQKPIIFD